MKITDVDIIPIRPRLAERNRRDPVRFAGIDQRVVCRVRTDDGLVGYGDHRGGAPSAASVEPLIGRSPFEFIGNGFDPAVGGALYDVMGKHLGVPAYRLMGPKVRDAVSVAAWTRQASPEEFAAEVERAAQQGYLVIKMHTTPVHDVREQVLAAEEVAPEGFRLHFDLNGSRTLATLLPIVRWLEGRPVVGCIEDPCQKDDLDSWCRLREQTTLPLVFHVPPGEARLPALGQGAADAYLIGSGGSSIGDTLANGTACARLNTQCLIQLTGGTLTKALGLHMAAVLPTATGHSIHLDDQYEDDITTGRIEVAAGCSPVPERPGLGFDVDEDALERLAANPSAQVPRHLERVHLPGGRTLYARSPGDLASATGREEGAIQGLRSEAWHDDGSEEFRRAYERVRRDGPYID